MNIKEKSINHRFQGGHSRGFFDFYRALAHRLISLISHPFLRPIKRNTLFDQIPRNVDLLPTIGGDIYLICTAGNLPHACQGFAGSQITALGG